MLFTAFCLTACDDDEVYKASEPVNTTAIAVTDAHGSAATGWNVTDIPAGTYDLEFYTMSAQSGNLPYVQAADKMTAIYPSANVWVRNVVKGIKVTDGNCSIALHNGNGVQIKKLQLISSANPEFNLIKGGDISELSYVEDNGGKYYDAAGNAGDCLDILRNNGMNLVRLRLYNDPGNPGFAPSGSLPAGYQDEQDILGLARRAREKGMQILLTFHYSDYWTNGDDQNKPHEWADLDFDGLKNAVHDYTAEFLQKMAAQGTAPEFVAIGNEIQAGLLYPDGACADEVRMCALLNEASRAVREAAPEAKIVIHTAGGGDLTLYKWFYGLLRNNTVDFDIIGVSYYPFWSAVNAASIRTWADQVIDMFDKDMLIMETGYAWNATLPGGNPGQLTNNGPYAEFSKLGQRDFVADLSNQIKQVKSGRLLGYIYWDPVFIETPGLGWIVGGPNVVSNTTLFGFGGESLPVLDAYKYNN